MLKLKNPRVCKHPYDMPWKACCICSADTDASIQTTTITTTWTMGYLGSAQVRWYIPFTFEPLNVFCDGTALTHLPATIHEDSWSFTYDSWIYYPATSQLYIKITAGTPSPNGTHIITYQTNIPLIEAKKYPICMMVKHEGKWYCREHFTWRFKKQMMDEPIDIVEEELDVD